ncbi:MAG: SDR family oxidoreductase [Burkholderiales bacterium]|nr:SDR family oxidoreductase [Burkholderiales bacterium]
MSDAPLPVAIVTGAARGIGFSTATELARKGFRVALADLDVAALNVAGQRIGELGASWMLLPGDTSDFSGVQRHAERVVERFGRIDLLVNNAGMSQPKRLLDITEEEWDRTIDVNLKSCFNWCRAAVPAMLVRGAGRIVNVSSVSAHTGGARSAVSKFAYCASKAGVLGLTRGLAKELAPHIMVNAVCPGSIETQMTAGLIAAQREAIVRSIPMARVGTPEDVAAVIVFLATVEPNYLTGEIIDVDGGQWVN